MCSTKSKQIVSTCKKKAANLMRKERWRSWKQLWILVGLVVSFMKRETEILSVDSHLANLAASVIRHGFSIPASTRC